MLTKVEDMNDHRLIHNLINGFIAGHRDRTLQPLRLTDVSLSNFLVNLEAYQSVLNGGGSIAFNRGDDLSSFRLSSILEELFETREPPVREGPKLTWAAVVLFAGPGFKGRSKFHVGESLVELPEKDFQLLCSGRPWRFLTPWPGEGDREKELRWTAMALQELDDTQKMMQQGAYSPLCFFCLNERKPIKLGFGSLGKYVGPRTAPRGT